MGIEPKYLRPKINAWFEPHISHTGRARAEFSSPLGVIEGSAEIRVDDSGAVTVHVTVGDVSLQGGERPRSVFAFLQGIDSDEQTGRVIMRLPSDRNRCQNLGVTTDDGVYTSLDGNVLYSINTDLRGPEVADITFRPRAVRFVVHDAGNPYYSVLPLCNLISSFERSWYEGFDTHPLRLHQAPDPPSHLSEREREGAVGLYHLTSPIIGFPYGDEPAFIEPVTEYETTKDALLENDRPYAITAVMVLMTGAQVPKPDTIGSWGPLALLPVLMLAEGRKIGVPWIETRDDHGRLVQRLHLSIRCFAFARWEAKERPVLRRNTGELLRCAQNADALDDPCLWVAIRNFIESRNKDLSVEEQLVQVCRGIEALAARGPESGSTSLLSDISPEHRRAVRGVIRTACGEIKRVAQEAAEQGAANDGDMLRTVANKLESDPPYRDAHFGRIVVRLLRRYSLSDDEALEHAWEGGLAGWMKTARDCRNTPMHGGYFDFSKGLDALRTKTAVAYHLTDILLRSLLKELTYEGDYESACIGATTLARVNRVKKDTPLAQLGYDPSAWV